MVKKVPFRNRIVMIGFGSIGQAILPLLLEHLELDPSKITIITSENDGKEVAKHYNLNFKVASITKENYKKILGPELGTDDLLLNMSVDVYSIDIITLCDQKGAVYIDLSIEPWGEGYLDPNVPPSERSNYALREESLKLKNKIKKTAVVTHGANPGLVSHLMKQALVNMAKDNGIALPEPKTRDEWANLANVLQIKSIHITERDTQITNRPYNPDEFVNTWSAFGLVGEGLMPAELGWGTHERKMPARGRQFEFGGKAAIYIERPGFDVLVRTWGPSHGAFHGFLITHAEAISIAEYLSVYDKKQVSYRPTVHYAYLPCPDAVLSLHHLAGTEWKVPSAMHVVLDEITEGYDELGVLLMGNPKGAYWYGSTLTIQEARSLMPHNNATTLQVAAGALAGVLWALEHPNSGLIEPEDIDYRYVLDIAMPYLGDVRGCYTDWTPLKDRSFLFSETMDETDPWQFTNIKVTW
jgi:homospermidine synthase